ncbi:MAG: peptide ABC transporter substrate-binding protein [Gemmatimonadaceae bacterium]
MIFVRRIASARWMVGLCVCFVALAGIHCSRGDRPHADRSALTVLYDGDERRWPRSIAFLEMALPDENGEWRGRLAKSWDHSSDYRTWTYHLRTDVRWHDGVPVTANDVKFTLDLLSHPAVLQRPPGAISVTVLDDSTAVITYNKGFARTSPEGSVYFPKHLLEDLDPSAFNSWEFWTRPVGNGAYRYVRHVPKTLIEFEANPDYALGRAKIDRLIVKFGPSSVTDLLSGNVDAVSHFRRGAAEGLAIKRDPRLRMYYEIWDDILGLQFILWNQRNPIFSDPRVRRALTLAINRRELHRVLNMWEDLPIVDVVYTERQYWQGALPEGLPYDREQASKLLDQAGWRDRDGDGVRERDGQEFRFPLIVGSDWQAAAVYVQAQLRQVGIRMDITTLEPRVAGERARAGKFDAALIGLWSSVDNLVHFFGEDSPIGYRNTRVIQLLDAAQSAQNPDEMDEIFRGLMPIFREDLPFTFLVLNVETYVAHRKVKGLSTPFRANPLWSVEHLWIEDQRN